jgi:mannose-1-phosphate guanylyltransferase
MVLAAGFGTRLRPLTDEVPKPLLPVGAQPLLVSTLEQLGRAGAESLSINAHYLGSKIDSHIQSLPFKVQVFSEEKILGTAGGIRGALDSFRAPNVIVVNGDMYGPLPLDRLLEDQSDAEIVLLVRARTRGEGTVGLDAKGRVIRLRGEVFGSEQMGGDYLGVARLTRSIVATFPGEGCLVGDVLLPALRRGAKLSSAALADQGLTDIGDLKGYFEANLRWLEETGRTSYVAPSVSLPRAIHLEQTILGDEVEVRGNGELRRVIALPGAKLAAPLTDAIVTPRGRIVRRPESAR